MHPVLFHIGPVLIPSYGGVTAVGVLLGLLLAQRTARIADLSAAHLWNLCVLSLCAALAASRLLLIAVNWRELLRHPLWMLGLATIHHPLVAAAGAVGGLVAAFLYARWQRMPMLATADALAAPLVLSLAVEQFAALLAGSGFGSETSVRWAVLYTDPLAARWSGAPLGIPVHPVQVYAGLAYLTLALLLLVWLPARIQSGDVAGLAFLGIGVVLFISEFWRDREGRGSAFHGVLDTPQIAAILSVLAGTALLRLRQSAALNTTAAPFAESSPHQTLQRSPDDEVTRG